MMKKILIGFTVIGLGITFNACTPNNTNSYSSVHIHLQNGFDHDFVRVGVDGSTVFEDTVTTNQVLGFAHGINLEKENGLHSIILNINNTGGAIDTFLLENELWIGVGYVDTTNNTTIEYSGLPYIYE